MSRALRMTGVRAVIGETPRGIRMLGGLWTIDISDTCGMSAAGLVLFRSGIVFGADEVTEITGTYEQQGAGFLATLDVVLSDLTPKSDARTERVQLHLQGRTAGHLISASGICLSDAGRRAYVRLERRAIVERNPAPISPPMDEVPDVAEPLPEPVEDVGRTAARAVEAERSLAYAPRASFPKGRVLHEVFSSVRKRPGADERAPLPAKSGGGAPSSAPASTDPPAGA